MMVSLFLAAAHDSRRMSGAAAVLEGKGKAVAAREGEHDPSIWKVIFTGDRGSLADVFPEAAVSLSRCLRETLDRGLRNGVEPVTWVSGDCFRDAIHPFCCRGACVASL